MKPIIKCCISILITLNIISPVFAAPPPSTFIITHPSTGSTCGIPQSTATIVSPKFDVTAIRKGTTVTSDKARITLITSSGRGNWTIATGSGTLTQAVVNSGRADYQFDKNDDGVVAFYLTSVNADNLTVTIIDNKGATSTSSTIQYRTNEFVITTNPITIAGKPNNMTISMYKKDLTNGLCGIATGYNGLKAVKAWISKDPIDPNGALPKINGTTIPSIITTLNNLNLNFVNGTSTFNLDTTDVGKYILNIRDGTNFSNAININGVTSTLTFRPFGIIINNIICGTNNNPATTTSNGPIFCKAGQEFSTTATSYLWNSTSDVDNDGIPDSGKTIGQLSSGGITPSFKWNTNFTTIAPFYPNTPLDTPAGGGSIGMLVNPVISASSYLNGIATTNNLSYGEVGSFTLTGTSLNYLNTIGSNISIMNPTLIGRFTPYHFRITGGSIINRSNELCTTNSPFSYIGEEIRSAAIITAKNLSNVTTKNYASSYAKFNPASSNNWNLQSKNNLTNLTPRMNFKTSIGNFIDGVFDGYINYTFLRNSNPDGPFSTLEVGINPIDSENITTTNLDIDINGVAGNDAHKIGTTDVRFGRLNIMNNHGSDLLPLQIPMRTEYYNGTAFTINTLDNCTKTLSTMFQADTFSQNLQASEISFIYSSAPFVNGKSSITANKPSGGDGLYDGSFDIQYRLDNDNKTFLQGKWTGTTYTENPKAKITFGKQKNKSNNVLYIKELY